MKISFFLSLSLFLFAYEPKEWGESISGVITRFDTDKKELALTLDACGGPAKSSGYDKELIEYLSKNQTPAVLFINARWIDANPEIFAELSKNPNFDIQNHGTKHKPLSSDGKTVYGIKGTDNIEEARAEVMDNHYKIKSLTGKNMDMFRSGTAYYDDVVLTELHRLGYRAIGFSIIGDAGATFKKEQITKALLSPQKGDIIIAHFNHPESDTAEGLIEAIKRLKKGGWGFVRLGDMLKK